MAWVDVEGMAETCQGALDVRGATCRIFRRFEGVIGREHLGGVALEEEGGASSIRGSLRAQSSWAARSPTSPIDH